MSEKGIATIALIFSIITFFLPYDWWKRYFKQYFFNDEYRLLKLVNIGVNFSSIVSKIEVPISTVQLNNGKRHGLSTPNMFLFIDESDDGSIVFFQLISRNKRFKPLPGIYVYHRKLGTFSFAENFDQDPFYHTCLDYHYRYFYYGEVSELPCTSNGNTSFHLAYYPHGTDYITNQPDLSDIALDDYRIDLNAFRKAYFPNSFGIGEPLSTSDSNYELVAANILSQMIYRRA